MNRVNNSMRVPMRVPMRRTMPNMMSSTLASRARRRLQYQNREMLNRTAFRNGFARGPAARSISMRRMAAARTPRRPMIWPIGDQRSRFRFAGRARW